jgi:hypothetical protein
MIDYKQRQEDHHDYVSGTASDPEQAPQSIDQLCLLRTRTGEFYDTDRSSRHDPDWGEVARHG